MFPESVELLIKAGADVNKTDGESQTALFIASTNNHVEIVRLLIKAGARVNKADVS